MNSKVATMVERDAVSNDNARSQRLLRRGLMIGVGLTCLLVATGAICLLLLRSAARSSEPSQSHAALAVTTATPRRTTWPVAVVAQGAIAPWEEASIGTQIGSYQLIEVRANVGDQVKRGEVLAHLNPALLRAEEAQLMARDAQAEANQRRALGLRKTGGISDQDVLQATTEARTAAALLAAKRLELRYTAIVAPDDGVISARTATTGAVVPAGQELFRMIRRNRLEWRGELTAAQIRLARRGQTIALDLPDGSHARGRIREFAPSLDGASRLGIVYADILPDSRARAGMYANGTIAVSESAALVVPAESVVIRDGRSYVMLLPQPGKRATAAVRAVTTGRRRGGDVEIVGGLSGTERLVRSGAAFLDDGDVVDVTDAGSARP